MKQNLIKIMIAIFFIGMLILNAFSFNKSVETHKKISIKSYHLGYLQACFDTKTEGIFDPVIKAKSRTIEFCKSVNYDTLYAYWEDL